jgi:predicted SprT family Zn-dependent metalloprotease
VDDERIRECVAGWGWRWGLPDLAARVRVVPGPRMRRSLGRCEPATGLIRLHARLWDEPGELFREVLCHEVAHVAVLRLHGAGVRPHGVEWMELMRRAGFEPRATVAVGGLSGALREAARPAWVYEHRCPACGARRHAGRVVRNWRCRRCRDAGRPGRLEITRLPAAPA